jgi:cytochrome c-type biogenesis protein CcmH
MLLWLGLALMTAAVLAVIVRPLLGPSPAGASAQAPLSSVYRDQLAEIEAEVESGQIGPAEAEAARAEIARRLIASDAAEGGRGRGAGAEASVPSGRLPARVAAALALGLPAVAMGLYLLVGAPGLPARPPAIATAIPPAGANIEELVRMVEARLRQHPEDGQGWDVIAPVYLKQGRYREAADAYGRSLRSLGDTTRRLAGFAESTILASNGIVTEPARLAYEKIRKLEPDRPEPRFWLALAREQDGDLATAAAEYEALLAAAAQDVAWRPLVLERLEIVRTTLAGGTPKAAGIEDKAPGRERGPSADDMAAAERLEPEDRSRMINQMVDGLAERLKKDGRDLAGWQRLIRAYSVLGRKSDALRALTDARRHFTGEPQSLDALAGLARSLGLES